MEGKEKVREMECDFGVEVGNKEGVRRGIVGRKGKDERVK